MDKVISIHQPETLPYIGFFSKMSAANQFVILDSVQFTKNNFQNRNRILHQGKPKWVTLPVVMDGHLNSRIRDMKIANTVDWKTRNMKAIYDAYNSCEFFNDHYDNLAAMIRKADDSLFNFNMSIIYYIRNFLDIKTPLIFSSEMELEGHKSDLVLGICKQLNAQIYLSGSGGRGYMDLEKFRENGIRVAYQHYDSELPYHQEGLQNYVPYMSVVDLIMNNSKEDCKKYLIQACSYEID